MSELTNPLYKRIAIAQPSHAPYGQRAKEALIATGNWSQIKDKIVFGENVAQSAQFANSGAVDIAIIALSLVNKAAENPEFAKGTYSLIDKTSHQPLQQTYVLTNDGEQKTTAKEFISFLNSRTAKHILQCYGFELPADGQTTPSHDVDELRE
ncbi:MAG: molybdate ABC transporter substrate-binding protein [Rheinheimera sp.]|nr:molybdate ABC transporter substrate-binding protein [Rheinheimera sp.]